MDRVDRQAYAVGDTYKNGGANMNLSGSPDYRARIRRRRLRKRLQHDPAAVHRPASRGLFRRPSVSILARLPGGCFQSALDLLIPRTINLGGGRSFSCARISSTPQPSDHHLTEYESTAYQPFDPVAVTKLPYDADGNLVPARTRPNRAGFGLANEYSRQVQLGIRFRF